MTDVREGISSVRATATKIEATVEKIDTDQDGVVSSVEIATYLLGILSTIYAGSKGVQVAKASRRAKAARELQAVTRKGRPVA